MSDRMNVGLTNQNLMDGLNNKLKETKKITEAIIANLKIIMLAGGLIYLIVSLIIFFINRDKEDVEEELFTQHGNKLVIVYADFCIWSKRLVGNKFIPSYEGSYDGKGPEGEYPELKSKMKKRGYEVELINAEKNPDKAKEYGANGFPNIFIVKNGKITNTIPGFMNTKNIIKKYF